MLLVAGFFLRLIAMILMTLGAGAWYIKTRFDTLNELSTPPPEISPRNPGCPG